MFLALFVLAFVCSAYGQTIPTPVILSVSRDWPEILKLHWKIDNPQGNLRYTRYRIEVSMDDFATSNEWPAQIKRVNYDSTDAAYKQFTSRSNFDCYNACIRDPACGFVVRSAKQNGDNCFLKAPVKTTTNTSLDVDSEYIQIDDYSDTAMLNYLSNGLVYSFKITVYESTIGSWSPISAKFGFNTKLNLNLNFVRDGRNSGRLLWQNNNFTFSRFNLYTLENDTFPTEYPNINPKAVETYEHPSGYFSIQDFTNFTSTQNKTECIVKCLNDTKCVQLVYFTADYLMTNGTILAPKFSCYINYKLDLNNALYKKADVTVLSVRNTMENLDYYFIVWANWQFTLEAMTPYGVLQIPAGNTVYNITDGTPVLKNVVLQINITLSWKVEEPLSFRRYALYYFVNDSAGYQYYIEPSSDYRDPNQIVKNASTLNECFYSCYDKLQCLAFTFKEQSKTCELKTDLSNKVDCANSTICATIPEYSDTVHFAPIYNSKYCFYLSLVTTFNYTTPVGKLICTGINAEITTQQVDQFYPGKDARILCKAGQFNHQIYWFKNLEPLNLNTTNTTISDDLTILTFHRVSGATANGVYHCENKLNNSQVLVSNMLNIKVNETAPGVPARPRVEPSGTYEKPAIIITWDYDRYISPVKQINLFTSTDNSRFTNKTYSADTLASGLLLIEDKFECKTTFKFSAINSVGSSALSDAFNFNRQKCEESPQMNPKNDYLVAFHSDNLHSISHGNNRRCIDN